MVTLQLDFFEKDEITLLRMDVEANKRSTEKVRKGTYSRINQLEKQLQDVNERLAVIEAQICKGEAILRTQDSTEINTASFLNGFYG